MPKELEEQVLRNEIDRAFPAWKMSGLTRIASGLEATVFRVETAAFGSVALKVPHIRYIDNDNDRGLDARDLLRQDAAAFEHLQKNHLPAPNTIALHLGQGVDFLAYTYIQVDDSMCSPAAIGHLIRSLHEAPIPDFLPVAHRGKIEVNEILAQLTYERLQICRQLSRQALPDITLNALLAVLTSHFTRRAFLHMDIRAANLLCKNGTLIALIDWSNALLADPVFELARIAEYGWPIEEVLQGYGDDLFVETPAASILAARLYTASMLAVVFLSEAPDQRQAVLAVERVRVLLEQFALGL